MLQLMIILWGGVYLHPHKMKIMEKVGIFYGSSSGNTEKIAEMIRHELGEENAQTINVTDANGDDLQGFRNLIFGTPTWELGEMQEDWEEFMEMLEEFDFKDKKLALFGLGDQEVYADSFADGVGVMFNALKGKVSFVGEWPDEGYLFDSSEALQNGKFVGLILDEDNQPKMSGARIKKWVAQLKNEFV